MKILDCTLRDGGYYTNWDFSKNVVEQYIDGINQLPIDYIEIGYRNNPTKEYQGKYAYCPLHVLRKIRERTSKKIVLMLNEKNITPDDTERLIKPIIGLVDMIRMAIDPENFDRALTLTAKIKEYGLDVGFNMMYMSKWKSIPNFEKLLLKLNGKVDAFFMVDSYGGITPSEVNTITKMVKKNTSVPVGFHGHNNLELALINSLTALESGAEFIDATILGMGRGAGNLKMELLLTYLNSQSGLNLDFNALGKIITSFTPLLNKYQWGTNLPYMLSGANSLPQKDVMDWVSNRMYSLNSIVQALNNKKNKVKDNMKYPLFNCPSYENIMIVGGGSNVVEHIDGIKEFIKGKNIAIIHATAKNALHFLDIKNPQYYCMVGSEGTRIERIFADKVFRGKCILPPYPRTMGTDVPNIVNDNTVELDSITITDKFKDSCTAVALEISRKMSPLNYFIIGYDGYPDGLNQKERDLSFENEYLFSKILEMGIKLISLTPTLYKDLIIVSVYSQLDN